MTRLRLGTAFEDRQGKGKGSLIADALELVRI